MVPTILLAQEFGANLGHVSNLLVVARHLGPARFVVAVPHAAVTGPTVLAALGSAVEIVDGMGFRGRPVPTSEGEHDTTLGDVLFKLGYADPATLGEAARRWRALIDQIAPDLVLSDFAPTLRLAAWDRVPTVVVGNAYETPPPGVLLPSVVPAGTPPPLESVAREAGLLAAARHVRAAMDGPHLSQFGDLLQGEKVFALAAPGCDAYAAQRDRPALPPLGAADIVCGPPFARRNGPDIFCFMWADHPRVDLVLTALNGLRRRSQVHIRGVAPEVVISQSAPHVGVHTQTADFATLLPQTRLFIHYGGAIASYAAMLAGTVQLVLPIHLEQEMTTLGLVGQGIALGIKAGDAARPEALVRIISDLLANDAMQRAALSVAASARSARSPHDLAEVVGTCRRFLDTRSR